jgi:hypothetical protein
MVLDIGDFLEKPEISPTGARLALEPANHEGVGKVEVRRSVVDVAAMMIDQMTGSGGRS